MKKYQLKYNDGIKLLVIKESDIMYDILKFVNNGICVLREDVKRCSIWMDGKVLD